MRYLTPNPLNILEYINNNDVKYTTITITSNYTIQETDSIIICNNTNPIQITLPSINNNIVERLFIIYKAGTGSVTITTSQNNTIFLDGNNNNLTSLEIQATDKKYLLLIPKSNNVWYVIDSGSINTSGGGSSSTPQNVGQYGYVCGGYPITSTIDRFQFPFDSGNAIQVGNLSGSRRDLSANNSSIHGYVCGGYYGEINSLSIIDRFQFPFDSGNAIQVGNLSKGRGYPSANNSSIYGYVCNGFQYNQYAPNTYTIFPVQGIDRFQFPFDSGNALQVGNLSGSRYGLSANNSSIYGYVCGGAHTEIINTPYSVPHSTIDRFQFPFDSGNALQVGNLSGSRYGLSANNSSIHGYVCGGLYTGYLFTIDRFQFPFVSGNAVYVGNLSVGRYALSANNSSIHGYVCGGHSGSSLSTIDRFQFPFDSGNAVYVSNLSGSRSELSANDDTFIPNVMY